MKTVQVFGVTPMAPHDLVVPQGHIGVLKLRKLEKLRRYRIVKCGQRIHARNPGDTYHLLADGDTVQVERLETRSQDENLEFRTIYEVITNRSGSPEITLDNEGMWLDGDTLMMG